VRVVAVVLNWRRPEDTIACVASLRAGTVVPQIIVVDNASGDASVEAIRAAHPDITLIEHVRNDGYAGGNNVGIARALAGDAEAVLVLNNDVEVAPDALEVLTAAQGGSYRITAPLSVLAGSPGVIDFYTARVDLRNMALIARGRDEPEPDPPFRDPVESDYATGSAMLIDADLLQTLGGFDERTFLVWEDVDLCLRARRAGARVLVAPAARVRHARGASFGADGSPLYKYFFVRNSFLILAEHGRWPWRARTRALIERRYEGWAGDPRDPVAARAIALGLEHGRTGRFGPPPPELTAGSPEPADR
jgi:hypothetical protein